MQDVDDVGGGEPTVGPQDVEARPKRREPDHERVEVAVPTTEPDQKRVRFSHLASKEAARVFFRTVSSKVILGRIQKREGARPPLTPFCCKAGRIQNRTRSKRSASVGFY